ncbi:hypothetical protein QFC21_000332 [Naganishia friedmannii]|uniref:Uncharacterized protein n=1 Tax=Naganishia friedmannii TaxID=89922 RepID=A0ACC2WD75_9TREE|nr:hypothetical protein QFC21_000332 [Naganishia friedmannii]
MSTPEDRLRLATTLIEQSPPGQVNDVLNDLRIILGDDSPTLRQYLLEHLRSYNLDHLQSVVLPGSNDQTLLCKAAVVPRTGPNPEQERYADPRSKRTFLFDHTTHEVSQLEDYAIPEEDEAFRAALDTSLQTYIQDHFASSASACAVFSSSPPDVPVSAASTIATEDAEEEQAILKQEDEVVDTTQDAEEGSELIGESEETAVDPSAHAAASAEAGQPDDKGEDSLLTKVVETIKDAVTAPAAKQGDEEEGSDTPVVQPVEPIVQETLPEIKDQDNIKSQEGELLPNINSDPKSSVSDESVQPEPPTEPIYTIAIVSNKYRTQNFWTGQWRSSYSVNPKDGSIEGIIHVDVHYFENGNVQLEVKERVSLSVATQSDNLASTIITAIAKNEQAYQMQLNSTYDDLREKNFKSLRRALPLTRQRVEWDKIAAYKAGGGQLSK